MKRKSRKQRIKEDIQEVLAGILLAMIPISMFLYWFCIGY